MQKPYPTPTRQSHMPHRGRFVHRIGLTAQEEGRLHTSVRIHEGGQKDDLPNSILLAHTSWHSPAVISVILPVRQPCIISSIKFRLSIEVYQFYVKVMIL